MSIITAPHRVTRFVIGVFEHAFFVTGGFVLMMLGMSSSVTMIMPPAGLAIGLLGFAMFVVGTTLRIDHPLLAKHRTSIGHQAPSPAAYELRLGIGMGQTRDGDF